METVQILRSIVEAVDSRSAEAGVQSSYSGNSREYTCKVDGCESKGIAKGLCNAHYLRQRAGGDMSKPVRRRNDRVNCQKCGLPRGAKGGWGLCPNHYAQERRKVIKEALIKALGGCCERCNGVFHYSVYDFHHRDPKAKEGSFGSMVSDASIEKLADEMAKCELLCANCHRIEHSEG